MARILIVDDEVNILKVVESYLVKEGYLVSSATDGKQALELFNSNQYDLVILDLMLPLISGEEVCETIRQQSDVPIIMLTAKNQVDDTIKGLELGADDYMGKPFSAKELVMRVKSILKRSNITSKKVYSFNDNDLIINEEEYYVKKQNVTVELTPNEFAVLITLVKNMNKVLTREQLISKTFSHDYESVDRVIDAYIKNIRKKIEDNTRKPIYIKTIYGLGYKFNGENNGNN